jgi:hypothetical protein
MVKEIIVTKNQSPYEMPSPVWFRLSKVEQVALINYQKKYYPLKQFVPPDMPVNLTGIVDVGREMSKAPESQEHMKK